MPKPMGVRLEAAKNFFFDRKVVSDFVDDTTRIALSRMGAYIRQRARSSLRRRKRTSEAGEQPSIHSLGNQSLKFILFAYEPPTHTVIVGPVLFGGHNGMVPELMEFGGTTTVRRRSKWRQGGYQRPRLVHYAARPFMRPALENEASKAPEEIRKASNRASVKAARRWS